eukprot:4360-Heterococcus_DN1.PRE.1
MQIDAAVSISIYSFHAGVYFFQLCVVPALLSVGHNVLSGDSVLAFAIEQAEDELEHYDLLVSEQDLTRGCCCTAAAAAACVVSGAPRATAAAAPSSSATATAAVRVILHLNQVSQRALAQDVGKLFSASAAAAAAAAACAPSHMSPLRASLRSAAPTTAAAI